ncbi:DUF885 domain-containing protein [Arthrobacter sp. UKPF54-2]|uniref:DUF885 domain-containing protein n=1 Tax=Arthrobacter sp. UKPF54-2 TaxID=2600159 RepID=UPI0011B10674|nr:DUF885 domain-containing protein [Arthrobacter sp. UKPF54-2]QDY88861.1 DUF885 domain-containing protein [Arthrobacter sp. UKPF54-2]
MTTETTENTTPDSPGARPQTAIDAVADAFTDTLIRLNPSFATELGLPGHETEYPDFSPAGHEEFAAAAREALAALEGLEPADDVDAVTLDAMRERLGLQLEIHESGWDLAELNNIASPSQEIRAIFDLMPTDTAAQWDHIAGRADNVADALDGYIVSLRTAKEAGRVAAARQVRIVIEQATKHTAEDGFFAKLAAEAKTAEGPLPEDVQSKLDAGAAAARAAYARLAGFLEAELLPAAPEKDAVGRERYALASRSFLGATVDLEETYAWGVQELDRLIAEQERVANQIRPGATIEEAKEILNNDPSRQLKGTDALRAWMQELSDKAVADLAGVHFDIPDAMKTLECKIAPTQEGGIYYTGPSDDFSRPGRMWWSVPPGEDTFTTWAETTTVYHEGVPGHHLQVATATYRRELLNKWRRNVCWTSGHGEGWALYAEKLMQELGYLKDPGDHMGMLDMQRMRAARVVFDIGVHLELQVPERWGSGTWTPDTGYEFLKQNLAISEGQLKFEFTRYLGWPGQAPSYKVGQRLWEQIRAELESRPGFDLKAFHTKALNMGSVGLDTLKRALLG